MLLCFPLRRCEEVLYDSEKRFQLIVVHPMPGPRDIDALRVGKHLRPSILPRVGCPTLCPPQEQGRTRDPVPDTLGLIEVELVG